jgi:hypothetical protein
VLASGIRIISQINFCNRILHVSDRLSAHHQESSTVYTVIGICHTGYVDCLLAGSGSFQKFVFGIKPYMFRTGFLPIIRSLVLYTQQ